MFVCNSLHKILNNALTNCNLCSKMVVNYGTKSSEVIFIYLLSYNFCYCQLELDPHFVSYNNTLSMKTTSGVEENVK